VNNNTLTFAFLANAIAILTEAVNYYWNRIPNSIQITCYYEINKKLQKHLHRKNYLIRRTAQLKCSEVPCNLVRISKINKEDREPAALALAAGVLKWSRYSLVLENKGTLHYSD